MNEMKICEVCQEPFKSRHQMHKFCTRTCREIARKEKDRLYREKRKISQTIHETIECEICEQPFIQKTKLQKICSVECRNKKKLLYDRHNITVVVLPKVKSYLNKLGKKKAQFVRDAIDEKIEKTNT